jgi:hypothetical protein
MKINKANIKKSQIIILHLIKKEILEAEVEVKAKKSIENIDFELVSKNNKTLKLFIVFN